MCTQGILGAVTEKCRTMLFLHVREELDKPPASQNGSDCLDKGLESLQKIVETTEQYYQFGEQDLCESPLLHPSALSYFILPQTTTDEWVSFLLVDFDIFAATTWCCASEMSYRLAFRLDSAGAVSGHAMRATQLRDGATRLSSAVSKVAS